MYKKFSLEQLLTLKTGFFTNFRKIMIQRRYPTVKTFLKDITKEGNTIYYWRRGTPLFRVIKNDADNYTFIDEVEKIELNAGPLALNKLHGMLKNDKNIDRQIKGSKSMSEILRNDFKTTKTFNSINGKPYLVYDIETTYATSNLRDTKYYIGYAYIVDENGEGKYTYIGPESLEKFVKFMVDFDGYIVGFNSIAFDNPVSVYNVPGLSVEEQNAMIDTINAKSIDLFLLLRNVTGKRIGLNRTATALVGVQKTLDSGLEGDVLMKQYKETGDEKFLDEFKKYCKNDVEMTVLVMFYLMKNQKVYLDNIEFTFTKDEFLKYSLKYYSKAVKSGAKKMKNKIFVK